MIEAQGSARSRVLDGFSGESLFVAMQEAARIIPNQIYIHRGILKRLLT